MTSFLGVPIIVDGRPAGNLYLTEKAGGAQFSDTDEAAVVILAEFAGVAIDHARRYAGLEARGADLERTVDTLSATLQIAHRVGGETDIEAILELVATRARALLSARAVVIEQQRGPEIVIAAGAGELPHGLVGQTVDASDSGAIVALRTGRTLRLEHDAASKRFKRDGLGQFGVHANAGLVVPLVFHRRAYGVLIAIDRLQHGPTFTADDQRLLEAFAASVARALATADAAATDRRSHRLAAAEQERARWARELHDQTLQALAAVRMALTSQLRGRDPERMAHVIVEAVRQLDAEISDLRSLITELRPAALDELGVKAALEALADRARRTGLEVHLRINLAYEDGRQPDRHTAELETALYRITQQALTNAARHANAQRALIDVHEEDHTVRVTIRDNGRGFDPAARTDGFGLLGMRERAELLNGTLEVNSAPGLGTTITATLPVRRRSDDPAGRWPPDSALRSA